MSAVSTLMRIGGALVLLAALSACGLPRSGPYFEELTAQDTPGDYDFHIVPLTPDVVRTTRLNEKSGFDVRFLEQRPEAVHTIARGDELIVTVWENIDEGLLNPAGIGATSLPKAKVDEKGRLFIPYIGPVKASGMTISQLRTSIQRKLATKTLNPQVDIYPAESKGRIVSVQGVVSAAGLYPIETPTTHILPMMAQAGGVSIDPEVARLKIRRGNIQGEIWLQDLYDDPRNDVHLKTGDRIIVERDRRIFTALGAVGGASTVQFPTREVSVIRALGIVGGLSEQTADPTGVFLFREETPEVASRVVPGKTFTETQRVAYIIDLTQPAGLFLARDMMMRNGDTIFATTAPFVRWLKILGAVSPFVNFAGSTRTLGGF